MMYKIEKESIKCLNDLFSTLDQLNITGIKNANVLLSAIQLIQKIHDMIDQSEDEGIVIDNTKKKE